MFSPENAYGVEQVDVVKNTEGSNEAIVIRRDGGNSTGVIVHGMLSKGLRRNLGGPMLFSSSGGTRSRGNEARGRGIGSRINP